MKKLPSNFWVASIISIVLLVFSLVSPESFVDGINNINKQIFKYFGDFYLYFVYLMLIVFIAIGVSPLGKIRLGGANAKPEHSFFSWFSMLFCAGMGVGLLFWGCAEPLYHFMNPPLEGTTNALQLEQAAMQMTFLHWAFHPWAIFGLTTLAVGFFSMNLKKGFKLSSFLSNKSANESINAKPSLLKRFFKGLIDNFTVLAVLFGITSSFGLGILQTEGGLNNLFGILNSYKLELGIILFITVCYMISTLRGLDKGIKVLSNISMVLSIILALFIPFAMPIGEFVGPLVRDFPNYIANIHDMGIGNLHYSSPDFLREWTSRYWAWWLSWAPFVGIFVSLVSKGRTVRELVFSMLLAPSVFSIIHITIMGKAAIFLQKTQEFIGPTIDFTNTNTVLYKVYAGLFPEWPVLNWLCLVVVVIFFVNSADSATYTLAAISQRTKDAIKISGDDIEINTPPAFLQIIWGLMFSVLAGVFLLVGGLDVIQATSLITVLPFSLFLVFVFIKMIIDMIRYYKTNYAINNDLPTIIDVTASEDSPEQI